MNADREKEKKRMEELRREEERRGEEEEKKTHPKLDSVSIIKILGTKFIISHTFLCDRYLFFLLVLEFDKKHHKGDFAGHCSIYS